MGRRKPLLVAAILLGAGCLSVLVYAPALGPAIMRVLFFVCGVCFGTMVIGFALARENNASEVHGAAFGLLNCSVVGTGAIFQPLLGAILDWRWDGRTADGAPVYDAGAYGFAFSALLAFLVIGLIASFAVREQARD
jgi:MFS family permease